MKKAIVLAGGYDQIALIRELKKRGFHVILIDYYENPPAKEVADKHIKASTLDFESVSRIALQENVDIIVTACTDQALLTMAQVSEKLGLPCYLDYKTALYVTNKTYMKDIMLKNNIPTANALVIHENQPLIGIEKLQYPLVIKPSDCNSSKGVKKIINESELSVELDKTMKLSRSKSVIIEEYKEGRELSADLFIENGIAELLAVTESTKIPDNNGSFTIMQSKYPVTDNKINKRIKHIGQKIGETFNLKNTPLLIQLIESEEELSVIEFSARMGGGTKYKLIEYISGVNIMQQYVNLILGEKVDIKPEFTSEYIVLNYIYCNKGILNSFINFEKNKTEKNIEDFFFYKTPGMSFEKAETSGDRAAGYLVKDPTEKGLDEKIQKCDRTLKIEDIEGNDLMIHNLF